MSAIVRSAAVERNGRDAEKAPGAVPGAWPSAGGQVHDASRVDYMAGHIGQLARAIDDGCDVRRSFA
jgi:hypothetical protein